jgi:hypothetical protein
VPVAPPAPPFACPIGWPESPQLAESRPKRMGSENNWISGLVFMPSS